MKKLYVHPKGNRVIIEQEKIETITASGIVIKLENEAAEQAGNIRGTLVAVGEDCWDTWSSPWAKIGDEVLFAKFAGKQVIDHVTGESYLIMMDRDIIATLEMKEDD